MTPFKWVTTKPPARRHTGVDGGLKMAFCYEFTVVTLESETKNKGLKKASYWIFFFFF